MFTKEQINFLKNNNIALSFEKGSEKIDFFTLEKEVSLLLQQQGFDENYEPTEIGLMCESILDSIP